MPIEKPKKPTELIPRAFGGIKNNFSDDLQSTGFEPNIPQTYNGDNLNYHLDATGKELDYVEKVVDFINQAPVNHVPFVNENNQLDYVNKDELGGGGLEIGDIAFTQMAIDESKGKRRKLNGQIIIQEQYQELTNILKASIVQNPDMACTEQEWQAEVTMSTTGICYKFVVDDEGGTIRLPKYPNYFIGGINNNAQVAGNGLALGLTNGSTNYGLSGYSIYGNKGIDAFTGNYGNNVGTGYSGSSSTHNALGITTDPTKSGIEAQVKQEQIKGTYFIQVATGSETEENIINTLELNNPFVLLEHKFFEAEVYNVSWLLANGTYNGSSAVHPSAYQALLVENNAEVAIGSIVTLPIGTEYTKRGLSVKLSTDSDITDYDFVVNTSDETFRLPTKVNLASGKAVVGNGMVLGLTDGASTAGLVNRTLKDAYQLYAKKGMEGNLVGTTDNFGANYLPNIAGTGVTTDPTKSGIETSDSNLYLYFYVGETVQNANLINAGRIEEKLSNIIPQNSELIASYGVPDYERAVSLTLNTTFTAPSNGVIEIAGNYVQNGGYRICLGTDTETNFIAGVAVGNIGNGGSQVVVVEGQTYYLFSVLSEVRRAIFAPFKGVK